MPGVGLRLRLDVDRQRWDDAVRFHLGLDLGRRCAHDRRQEFDDLDVGGNGNVRASVLRDPAGRYGALTAIASC